MPPGLVIIVAVLMALAVQLIRLRPSVPDAGRRARSWPGGRGCGSGDTMNYFTAHHLEVAGAQARPGDDAPPAVTRPQASDGQGRHPIRLAGTGQVTSAYLPFSPGCTTGTMRDRDPASRPDAALS